MDVRRQIEKVLSVGECVYVKAPGGRIGKTKVIGIEDTGVDTAYDFLSYDEYRETWWLTACVARKAVLG